MASKLNMKVVLSTTVGLALVAGCQSQIATKTDLETTVGKGSTTVANGPAAQPVKKTENPQAADPNANVDNANDGALDRSKGMELKASEGGVYVSDDGLLKAVFPPGSLSQNATVKMVRVDTGKLKNSDVFLNGIRYQMDLGDAYITPGSRVTVTSKADDRLVGELKSMYSDYTPERYSLSKDEKGNWNVTMSLRGATENEPAKGITGAGPTRGIMEEGGFPITPAKAGGGFKQDSRIEAFCNYYPPPKPAHYGDFEAHVTWTSDSESGLKGKNAYEASGSASGGDNRVTVSFSTNYSAAPLPKKYTITDTIPGTPARPQIDVDQYGNVIKPAYNTIASDYKGAVDKALATWAKNGAFIGFDGKKVDFTGSTWTQPGKPASTDSEFGKPEIKNAMLGAIAATSPEEIVDATNVEIGDANGRYVIGGHPYNGNCNCGAYVIVQDTSVIAGSGKKLTDSNGIARIQALQSYDSTQCSAGICAGGQVNFEIFAQASIKYPGHGSNATGTVDGFGAPASQDSAAGRPLELEVPKYSPYLKMTLTDSQGKLYNAQLLMDYELDGVPYTVGDADARWDFGSTDTTITKKFFMPNIKKDDPVKFTIKKIYSKDLTMIAKATDLKKYQNWDIQRNNTYDLSLDMIPNEAK
jgi:hypothetical protein